MNVMLCPLHSQKLGRILNKILRRLYGIRNLDRPMRDLVMAELGSDVDQWRADLPAFLNPNKVDSRLLRPLFQRQSNLLTLGASHAEILIYRPCLLDDYREYDVFQDNQGTGANVQRCLSAALSIVSVITIMAEADQLFAASWFTHYQAFCAAAVLYTFTLRNSFQDPSVWSKYFQAAEKCQGTIAAIKSEDSFARRFLLIMEEYRLEVVQKVQRDSDSLALSSELLSIDGNGVGNNGLIEGGRAMDNVTFLMDLPNWEQLDSLVSFYSIIHHSKDSRLTLCYRL